VLDAHRLILNILLNNARLGRVVTATALSKKSERPYTLNEVFTDLRKGIWSELDNNTVSTDVYRRNLQRAYIDAMGTKINPPPAPAQPPGLPPGVVIPPPPAVPGEARAIVRAELTDLDAAISRALPRATDRETRAHLQDARYQIGKILRPEKNL